MHVGHWFQHFIINFYERDSFAGDCICFGDHAGQHIADIAGCLAHANHQGPILADQTDMPIAGNLVGRDDAQNARMRQSRAGIHLPHNRARMIAELQCADHQPIHANIIDITMLAQHQVLRVIFGQARADAAIDFGQVDFFFVADGVCGALNGIHDLFVASAAAQVRRQRLFDIGAAGFGIVIDEVVGLHDDARNAEAALHAALAHESIGKDLLPIFAQPFGGGDRLASQLVHLGDASQQRLVIDLNNAAATGGLWRAAIFRRDDAHLIAQPVQQRELRVASVVYCASVQMKVNHEKRLLSGLAASQALFDRKSLTPWDTTCDCSGYYGRECSFFQICAGGLGIAGEVNIADITLSANMSQVFFTTENTEFSCLLGAVYHNRLFTTPRMDCGENNLVIKC